jgi:hypothetical protein
MTPEVFALKRNDIKSAIRIRRSGVEAGTWGPEDEHVIVMLQDDPTKLIDAIKAEIKKALPRMSDEAREEKNAKVGFKPGKAATKQLGAGGQVRYGYPGEKGGDKKPGGAQPDAGGEGAPQAEQTPAQKKAQQIAELPHPDVQPPAPDHPEKPHPSDVREPDPKHQPKHTLSVQELCAALGMRREVLQQIATRLQDRQRFVKFMRQHLKEFASEHGLDGDYFGLLFDVLTGKVPEGLPASAAQDKVAKKPGSSL